MKRFPLSFFITICLWASAWAQAEIVPQKVAENLYVVSGMGGNIAYLVTSKGVIVIDAGTLPRDGAKVVSLVGQFTKKPIKYLVYTHCHGDHVGGAAGFPANVTIIAHAAISHNLQKFNEVSLRNNIEKNYPERIAKLKGNVDNFSGADSTELIKLTEQFHRTVAHFEEYKKIKIRYPNVTFSSTHTIKLGGQRVDLLFKGAGHTNDNIVVVFRKQNALHAGDLLFNGMVPYLFVAHGGTPKGWLNVVLGLSAKDFKVVIPGHGEVGDMGIIKNQVKYFTSLTTDVKRMKDEGKTLDEVKAALNAGMYGLKGNEPQFPINVEAVFEDL